MTPRRTATAAMSETRSDRVRLEMRKLNARRQSSARPTPVYTVQLIHRPTLNSSISMSGLCAGWLWLLYGQRWVRPADMPACQERQAL